MQIALARHLHLLCCRRQLTASPFRPLLDDGGDDAGAACKSRLRAICTFFAAVGS
ncbi:hypothetical protein SAMCCGM7_Ch1456 [Sinorhizobium americanum CCGM7]|nr:hypothetical protein SAMCCGM7_Ch1456 [Sinorhizobium americanum CCGM7]